MNIGDPTGSPAANHPAPILRLGARGEWVKTLQEMLGLPADGVFGRSTMSALAHFQNTHGLHANGETTAQTWNLLGTDAPGHAAPASGVKTVNGVTGTVTGTAAKGGAAPQSVGALSFAQLDSLALHAGATDQEASTLASIAMAESSGNPSSYNNNAATGDNSYGLWQINMLGAMGPERLKDFGLTSNNDLFDPMTNARVAVQMLRRSGGYNDWTTYTSGKYQQFVPQAQQALTQARTIDPTKIVGSGAPAGTTVGGAGAGAGNAQFSQQDINAELDNLGLPKSLINGDKGLQSVFKQIVSQQIDLSTPAGQDRAMTLFKNTKWWKARSDSQRKFDVEKVDNPGEFGLALQNKQKDLQTAALSMGIPLNGSDLSNLTQLVVRNGLDDTATRQALAQHFAYNPGGKFTGEAGLDIAGIQQLAASQYQNVSDATLNSLVDNLLANNMNPQSLQDYFKQLAVSKFPHLQKQLEAGQTVADIADPYKQQMAQRLEVDPTGIKNEDPTVMKALQQPTGKGDFQLMPLWQYDQMLKQDPRWMQTNNARDSLVDMGTGLLRNMGLTP